MKHVFVYFGKRELGGKMCKGVGVVRGTELKLEDAEASHTLGRTCRYLKKQKSTSSSSLSQKFNKSIPEPL